MQRYLRYGALAMVAALAPGLGGSFGQDPHEVRLPNGKLQQEEILKADYAKSRQDAATLVEVAQSLQQELDKNDCHVLSVSSIRKTEEIEKLAKRIRARMRRR